MELCLLGAPVLRAGGATFPLRERKMAAMLALLALADTPRPRAAVAALLWPEHRDPRARLRRLLHKIAARCSGLVVADGPVLALAAEVHCDAAALIAAGERQPQQPCAAGTAATLLRAWRGGLLDGSEPPGCEEFEEWLAWQRARVEQAAQRLLLTWVDGLVAAGDVGAALEACAWGMARTPGYEALARRYMELLLAQGRRDAARGVFDALQRYLAATLGVQPEPQTRALLDAARVELVPETRYACSDDVHIAWTATGDGAPDIVLIPGFVSHIEHFWAHPLPAAFVRRLAAGRRLIAFDRRGMGLSDRLAAPATLNDHVADLRTVCDAAGSRRAVIFAASEAGPVALAYAAYFPERVQGLVLWGTLACGSQRPDYPWALSAAQFDRWAQRLTEDWGGAGAISAYAPGSSGDDSLREWFARHLRLGSSPAAIRAVLAAFRDLDVRDLLPRVRAPTLVLHRAGDRAVRIAAGRHLAEHLPNARLMELGGDDHWFFTGNTAELHDAVDAFLGSL